MLTSLACLGVADELYDRVRTELSEREVSDLTFEIMAINACNRVNIAFKVIPGSYDKAFGLEQANLA